MKVGVVTAQGVELAFEQFGRDEDPAILMLMGNSAPGLVWPDRLCELLSEARFRVIRYDQRDTGLSTSFDFAAQPYTLHDLVDDAFGLLDGLAIPAAHLVGLSQGGIVACLAALARPAHVLSITTIMSSPDLRPKNDAFTGRPQRSEGLPAPSDDYVRAVIALNSAPATSDEEIAERFMENFRLAAGAKSPFDDEFWLDMGRAVATRRNAGNTKMANHSNHSRAQVATPPLSEADLAQLALPFLVIHGGMDPIFPPAHARWTASAIRGAELCMIDDMGHALDPAFIEPIALRMRSFLSQVTTCGRRSLSDPTSTTRPSPSTPYGDRPPRAADRI